jgi:hypothetical protein
MTSFKKVYDAFLSKILDDEWEEWTYEDAEQDWLSLLEGAIARFKFPRVSLEHTGENFNEDLSNDEIQILASYMKCEWLNRTILTWENVKPLYDERDFSQANLIDKFNAMLAAEQKHALQLESIYYRSVNKKPFSYRQLATQIND